MPVFDPMAHGTKPKARGFLARKPLQVGLVLLGLLSFSPGARGEYLPSPTVGLPDGFVALYAVAPDIVEEMRYAGPHNFTGHSVAGYLGPHCILTQSAAEALKAVDAEVREEGVRLKVYDCYRPQKAVDDFMHWAQDLNDETTKALYYPAVAKSKLFEDGYIAEHSGHSRGSTVDLTLVPLHGGRGKRNFEGCRGMDGSINMGTGFDCFDPAAHTESPAVDITAHMNRMVLKTAMEHHGFHNLPEEWWHYTLDNEPFPDRYFDFDIP